MTLAATVAGTPVRVEEVDAREAALRTSPQMAALPRPGTSEGRQLRRWLTQLLVTERVIAREAFALRVTASGAPAEADLLPDLTARLEIGSIAAGVLADPLARALYAHVTAGIDVDPAVVADYHRRNPRRFARADEPTPDLDATAPAIAAMLRGAARRRAFRIWLEGRRADLVWLAPGYEHPGDPRQPDNVHRH